MAAVAILFVAWLAVAVARFDGGNGAKAADAEPTAARKPASAVKGIPAPKSLPPVAKPLDTPAVPGLEDDGSAAATRPKPKKKAPTTGTTPASAATPAPAPAKKKAASPAKSSKPAPIPPCRTINNLPPDRLRCRTQTAVLLLTPQRLPAMLGDFDMRVLRATRESDSVVRLNVRVRNRRSTIQTLNASGRQLYLYLNQRRLYTDKRVFVGGREGVHATLRYTLPARLRRDPGPLYADLGVVPRDGVRETIPKQRGVIRVRVPERPLT